MFVTQDDVASTHRLLWKGKYWRENKQAKLLEKIQLFCEGKHFVFLQNVKATHCAKLFEVTTGDVEIC